MLIEHQHPLNKSITVSILGCPNVGKSSLVNYLMGMDLSIVTSKPQTTRNRINCVFTVDRTEVILIDTPGIHKSAFEINKRYNDQAKTGVSGSDVNLLLVDISKPLLKQFISLSEILDTNIKDVWVIFSKADKVENCQNLPLDEIIQKAKEIFPNIEKHLAVSSKTELNMNLLIGGICNRAKSSPHFYSNGCTSNKNERFFVLEYIREQAFLLLQKELPYEIAVTLDEFTNKVNPKTGNEESYVSASILVNKASQRGIVVGAKGKMIKEIGVRARKKMQDIFDRSVHLNLHVKVSPKWFANNYVLEEIGLPRAEDSARVWRLK